MKWYPGNTQFIISTFNEKYGLYNELWQLWTDIFFEDELKKDLKEQKTNKQEESDF